MNASGEVPARPMVSRPSWIEAPSPVPATFKTIKFQSRCRGLGFGASTMSGYLYPRVDAILATRLLTDVIGMLQDGEHVVSACRGPPRFSRQGLPDRLLEVGRMKRLVALVCGAALGL